MKVVVSWSKKEVLNLELPNDATVKDLKDAVKEKKRVSIHRQSFKLETGVIGKDGKPEAVKYTDDRKTLVSYGYVPGATLVYKDLGPQIGYQTVFVLEYAGPIFIMAAYALRPSQIYSKGDSDAWSDVAKLCVACWVAHFAKREYETFFVHRFSRPTMPLSNLFKNCWYYWGFANIGYWLCHPQYTPPANNVQVWVGLAIFAVSELCNFIVHVQLRNLRPAAGSKERPIPKGLGFSFVSCPNYTAEVMSWVGFSLMSNVAVSWAFTLVGFLQMLQWAIQKHKGYLKTYGDDYKKLRRKAMVPFVI